MRTPSRAAAIVAAALLALAFPRAAVAQKALVVCPPTDGAGCDRIAQQLALATSGGNPVFPGGVDKRYDELRTMPLSQLSSYSVVFVPSLANAPYALLREAAVQTRLQQVLSGRVAVWSGTPDRGAISGSSAGKLTLLQNLARWAAGQWGDGSAGLVVLQDFSDPGAGGISPRYDWVEGISGAPVGPDVAVNSYDQVEKNTSNPAANPIVGSLAYPNMASFGLSSPASPGVVGAWGQTQQGKRVVRGQIVLETFTRTPPPGVIVTSAGGTFTFAGGKVVLVFPPNALSEDRRITVAPATVSDPGYVAGTAYSFGPSGSFALPVSLTIAYDEAGIPAGASEANLVICTFKASSWSEVPSTVNTATNRVTASIDHFTRYAVFVQGTCEGGGGGGGGGGKPVGSVTVAPASANVAAKQSQLLTATVLDKQNNPLSGQTVTWSSTNGGSFTTTTGTTNGSGQVTTTFTVDSAAGTVHTITAAVGVKNATSTLTVVAGAAAKLAFVQQPTQTAAGSPITPAPSVAIRDAYGNTVTSATDNVTLAIGTNPSGGTLSGTATVAAVAGVATFPGLSINKVGTGYTLAATSGSLAGATSSAFDIVPGAAASLSFTQQPTNAQAGAAITPAVTVTILDGSGNTVTGSSANVTLAIANNPSGGTLSGTATVAAVNGVATFSSLSIDKVGTGYTLAATSAGLTGATSSAFDILPAGAAKLAFTVQPSNTAAGAAISPAVQVTIQDGFGNTVTSATDNVTLAIGTNPSGGTLGGTATVAAVNGVATFSNLTIDKAGTGYTLAATSGSLTGATSTAFDVTAGAASKLVFSVQPSNTTAGAAITPAVQVQIQDALGNVVTTATDNVSMAIGNNPSAGTLSGTTTVAAAGGVATFSDLKIDKAGTGYTLAASSGSLTGATSTAFDVGAGAPATVVVTPARDTIPTGGTAGFSATVSDAFGNVIPTPTITWSSTNPAAATVSPTSGTSTTATGASVLAADDSTRVTATSGSASGYAVLLVLAVSPPDAKDDGFTIVAGTPLSGNLFNDNGSGADYLGQPAATLTNFGGGSLGGSHAAGTSASLAGGTLTVNADGTFSLTGTTTGGTFTFLYRLTNSQGTDSATVTITVRRAPDAKDDAFNMLPGATLNGDLTANNGSGADDLGFPAATVASFGGGSLGGGAGDHAAGSSTALAGGTLTVNANGSFSLATPSQTGTFTFQYVLSNVAGADTATVTIVIQRPPDAKDDAFTMNTGTTLNGDVTANNGSGADDLGDPAGTVTGFGGGSLAGNTTTNAAGGSVSLAGGTLTLNANGSLSLANPTTGGVFTFRYRLTNPAGVDSATVTITVNKAPDAKDDAFTMLQGATLSGDLTANNGNGADDLGSPAATVASYGGGSLAGTPGDHAAGSSTALAGGTLTVNANGSFSLASPTTSGTFTFRYVLSNVAGADTATVTITIRRPPDAKDDAFTTRTGNTLNGNVTADNGSSADDLGDPAATVTGFGGGSLSGNTTTNAAGASVSFAGGTLTVNANGSFSLTNPTTGGIFTFRYRLTNVAGVDSATVTITVNAPPTAVADTPSTNSAPGSAFHTALNTTLATPSLLANDILGFPAATVKSFGGGTLGGTAASNTAGSTATFDGHSLTVNANGSFTYTPKNNFTGLFTFQYRIANAADSSDAAVTIAVGVRPSAGSSTYAPALVGNVPINTATSTGFAVTAAGDVPTYNVTVATGGTAVIAANRTFTFTPDAGFTGAASFSFTVTNGFGTSSAGTVSLTVGPSVVWFADASAPAGDGRKGTPFNCLVGASGCYNGSANLAGHVIYVADGTYTGTGALVLKNTQRVIGEGATGVFSTLAGITWPADAGTQPATGGTPGVIRPTTGNGINLGSGNIVRGVRVVALSGGGITGTSVGTLTLTEIALNATGGPALDLGVGTVSVTVDSLTSANSTGTGINLSSIAGTVTINGASSAITNPTGVAVGISGSNPTFTFPGTISKTNGSNGGISLTGMTGGTVSFTGPSIVLNTGTSAGINITGTPTVSFVDSVKVTTTTGNGISATGGTLTIAGTHNSVSSAGGIALNVSGATIGSTGLNFRRIDANGGSNGIVLSNTGTSGGLTVSGSGTAGSGGTIQNTNGADLAQAGNGIYLNGARNVSISWMNLNDHQNNGIFGTGVRGLTLDRLTLSGNQGNSNVGGSTEESALHLVDVGGAVKITNSTISGGAYDNVRIRNDAGTSPTVDSLVFANNTLGTMQGSAVDVRNHSVAMTFADGTADVRIRKNDVNFWWGTGIDVVFQGTASSTNVQVVGNNVTQANATPAPGASGIVVDGGNIKYDISSDTVMFATGAAIAVDEASNLASNFHGTIASNVIGSSGVTNSGSSQGSAISVIHLGGGTSTHAITNNVIRQINGIQAILLQAGDASASGGNGTFNATVTGNDIQETGSTVNSGRSAIILTAGTADPDAHLICADIGGAGVLRNNITNFNTSSPGNENRIRPNQRFDTTVRMPGYTGANNDNAAVATYLLGRNTATQVAAANSVSTGGGGYVNTPGGAACPQP